ncbi:MAG: 3-phosphoshikimate 1-carboxyvinyltransferase [Candidatus Baltobacteraceae bacterium]
MLTFHGGPLHGDVRVPGDKSISHRALLLGALSPHPIRVTNLNPGRDVLATANALRAIGARMEPDGEGAMRVQAGALQNPNEPIDCLNSGSTARMMMGVVSGANLRAQFDGDASLRRRPMEPVAAHLRAFGARIETSNGTLPATVRGTPQPQTRRFILVTPSAQIKTALLLAAAYGCTPIEISADKGSRDHTERLLRYFGAGITFDRNGTVFATMPLAFRNIQVAGDFSAAAFFIVAATVAPGSDLLIHDTGINGSRTGLLDALREMGANIEVQNEREAGGEPVADLRVQAAALRGISVGTDLALRAIDEILVLAVAAAFAHGETRITGVRELRTKESDRVAAVERLLRGAGIDVETLPNGIAIRGGSPRAGGGMLETQGDHRTAMAAAALAAGAGALSIDDESSIDVSFPGFADQFHRAQA